MEYGFIKVASAVPAVRVADCEYNRQQIETLMGQAEDAGVEIIVFPELCITAYTCQDLFRQQVLIDACEHAMISLLDYSRQLNVISIVGLPVVVGDLLLNCAAIIQRGKLLGLVPKVYLPNYSEFYEKRWFASAQDLHPREIRYAGNRVMVTSKPQLFHTADGALFGVELCEDVWGPTPPSNVLALAGADLIFNLSASDELIGKYNYLRHLVAQQSARTATGYVYSSCGFGESTQDVVYAGSALIYENGSLLAESKRFMLDSQIIVAQVDIEKLRSDRRMNTTFVNAQRPDANEALNESVFIDCLAVDSKPFVLDRHIPSMPFLPDDNNMNDTFENIFNIQSMGLVKRMLHTHSDKVILGVSGGLDSTLALLACVRAFDKLGYDRKGIIGVTMPGLGTTDRTYRNALKLMANLGVTAKEINITKSVMQHFEDIDHDIANHDTTYENAQARERTQILMDLANKLGGFVIGTGDLSELALGWATYNGDHMSMYGVNTGIPKTLIRHLVNYAATSWLQGDAAVILRDIVDTPISPELVPADADGHIQQKTEDLVGPYELHDFFLFYVLRYGFSPRKIYMLACHAFIGKYEAATIKHWLTTFYRRFFSQQFKRSCQPDGPKISSVSLSPRGDWRMPSDAVSDLWLKQCESL